MRLKIGCLLFLLFTIQSACINAKGRKSNKTKKLIELEHHRNGALFAAGSFLLIGGLAANFRFFNNQEDVDNFQWGSVGIASLLALVAAHQQYKIRSLHATNN